MKCLLWDALLHFSYGVLLFLLLLSAQPGDRQRDMPTSREARQRLSQGPARPNQVEPNSPLVAMLVILRNMAETRQCDMAVCTFARACVKSEFVWRGAGLGC
ncbi:hypothetical protein J3E69DRAFT_20373 [Trichoderma sp. SZMC 28015]